MQKAKCPVCSSDVIVGDEAVEGDIVECANCNSISELTSLHPATLNLVEDNSGNSNGDEEEYEDDEEEDTDETDGDEN